MMQRYVFQNMRLLFLGLFCFPLQTWGDSWEVVMNTDGERTVWWLDETFGARMNAPGMSNMAMIVRLDLKKNFWVNSAAGTHAVQPWGQPLFQMSPQQQAQLEMARQQMQNMPPEAQAFLKDTLDGIPGQAPAAKQPTNREYQRTGQQKQIGSWQTRGVAELSNGQPTGRQLWLANVDGWKKIGTTLDSAMQQISAGQPMPKSDDDQIDFAKLDGLPIRIDDPDGSFSEVVSIKPGKLTEKHMSPNGNSREVPLMQLMMQSQPNAPRR